MCPNSCHTHFLCSFLPALKLMGDCSSAQSAASLPGPFYSGPPDIPLSALQPRLMSLLSADRKWPQTAYPVRPNFSSVSTREVTAVAAHSIPSQASCFFCQCTGSDQFLCATFTIKPHVSPINAQKSDHSSCAQLPVKSAMWVSRYMNTQKMTPVPMCSIHSQACDVGLLSKMTTVPRQACNVGLTSHLHWRWAFACDGACPSLTCSFNRGNAKGTSENLCLMFVYVCFMFVERLDLWINLKRGLYMRRVLKYASACVGVWLSLGDHVWLTGC